jgi:signal transduction histidine kinase
VIAAAIPLLVLWTLPASDQLMRLPGLAAAWLALIFVFDALTAFLLIGQYRRRGGERLLVLSCAYLWSAGIALLIGLAVPGVLAAHASSGADAETGWGLWCLRHIGTPLLIGLALAPWPTGAARRVTRFSPFRHPARAAVLGGLAVIGLVALIVAEAPGVLGVVFDERRQQLTPAAAAVVLLVNVAAVVLSVVGVVQRRSHRTLESWAVVAATAFLGDVVYTFMYEPRFSVAYYGARALGLAASVTVLLFMLRDISLLHRRAAEDAHRLVEQNAALREANALRAHVTAVVSHDMRAPLAGLQGYLEMLQDGGVDPVSAKRMLDRSWMLTRRLTLLAENLLTVAALEHVELVVIREHLDMNQQLSECAICFPDLDLRVECPPDLTVKADSLRLQQVLANLVRNAQKHGAEPVMMRVTENDGTVTIRVSDSGPGVPTDFVPHLFERYTTGSDKPTGGAGLGLSVVKDLLAAQGGGVRYDRASCTFVVTLPSGTRPHDTARGTAVVSAPSNFDEAVPV